MKSKPLHLSQFSSTKISEQEATQLEGGYKVIPHGPGSFGLVNWDEIDIRNSPLLQIVMDTPGKRSKSRP